MASETEIKRAIFLRDNHPFIQPRKYTPLEIASLRATMIAREFHAVSQREKANGEKEA